MRSLAATLAVLCASSPAPARAQPPPPPELVIVAGETSALDLAEVRARLETTPRTAPGATLSISVDASGNAVLVLLRPDGTTMERTVALPDDPAERAEVVAILAVNMLHDESAELLALLGPADPAPTDAAAAVALAGELAAPAPPPVEVEVATPYVGADALADPDLAPEPPRPAFLRLGLNGHVSSVPARAGIGARFLAGLELAWTPAPWLAVGARELGGGATLQGGAWHVDGAPFFELGIPVGPVTFHADVGAHLQAIVDEAASGPALGVAPFGLGGIRFRIVPEVSVGIETALRVVATDRFLTGLYSLPQLALVWSGGLALLFHVR